MVLISVTNKFSFSITVSKRKKYDHKKTDGRISTSSDDSRSLSPNTITVPKVTNNHSPLPYTEETGLYNSASSYLPENWVLNLTQNSSRKQDPVELLCKIFPHKKRNVLDLILQGCGGDTVQAIEQVLTTQREEEKSNSGLSHPSLPLTPFSPHLNNSVFKSAFSPTTPFSAASHLNALRYGMGGHYVSRNLALTLPYPHFLPGLSVGSSIGTTSDDKVPSYSMYPFWPGKPYTGKELGKAPGCLD